MIIRNTAHIFILQWKKLTSDVPVCLSGIVFFAAFFAENIMAYKFCFIQR